MTAPTTMHYQWDGEAFVPLSARRADRLFVVGETYEMEVREHRSEASHRHYFAAINDAWGNLPEEIADRFATPDHLRRWCLIKAGHRDERTFVCKTRAEAVQLAAFMKPLDDYAVIVARETVVIVATAKSQSKKAMGAKVFQKSKDDVFRILGELLGTAPGQIEHNAGKAA